MATRRRTDGFSDDGLSYSVASDFDKQIGQALAEQEARLADPRFIPGARVESPDSPDILQRELIDPVLTAFGMDTRRRAIDTAAARPPAPRIFEMGNQLIQFDPSTRQATVVHEQKKTAPVMTPEQRDELRSLRSLEASLVKEPYLNKSQKDKLAETQRRIAGFSNVGAVPDMDPRQGDILGLDAPSRPKTLTRELAEQFKRQAKGDKDLARRLAREAGYAF